MEKRYAIVLHFDNQPFSLREYCWFKTEEEARKYAKHKAETQHADAYSVYLWSPITPSKTL